MSDQASRAAMRAAGPDEDARWRVMPRFGPWLWGFFALVQALLALMAILMTGADLFRVLAHPLLALLGLVLCVWSTSWTAAGAQGVRIRSGWNTYEIPWDRIASVESSRRWGFRLTTRSGKRRVMPGQNQSRMGLLLYLWEHYRGPDEPQRAMGARGRHGLWPAEPQRYIGARVGAAMILVVVTMVATLVVILSGLSLWVTVPIGAALLVLGLAALVRVMYAGTVVGPDGVKIRGPFTSQRVPWSSVQHVVVHGQEVAVVTSEGPATLVGVPAGEAATIDRYRHQGVSGGVATPGSG